MNSSKVGFSTPGKVPPIIIFWNILLCLREGSRQTSRAANGSRRFSFCAMNSSLRLMKWTRKSAIVCWAQKSFCGTGGFPGPARPGLGPKTSWMYTFLILNLNQYKGKPCKTSCTPLCLTSLRYLGHVVNPHMLLLLLSWKVQNI